MELFFDAGLKFVPLDFPVDRQDKDEDGGNDGREDHPADLDRVVGGNLGHLVLNRVLDDPLLHQVGSHHK